MGKYVEAGKSCVRHVDFIVGGELVTPDSVTYTLRNGADAVVNSLEDEEVADFSTSANITISSAGNVKSLTNEVRYLNVTFIYNEATYEVQDFYFLRTTVNFPVSNNEIRFVLGATPSEIPDDMIDIFGAYQDVQDESGLLLSTIMSAGGTQVRAAIQAVKYWAAIVCANAIESLLFRGETADNTKYSRFSNVDFDALRKRLLDQYNASLLTLVSGTATDPVFSAIGVGTDPVTNT